jgi:hypothetical protein
MSARLPAVILDLQIGRDLDDLRATAARLWLGIHPEADPAGELGDLVRAHWASRPGDDPYWSFLGTRGVCATCGTGYRYENLSICPNCLRTYCPSHKVRCACGFDPVG